jgi:hypothetical protein
MYTATDWFIRFKPKNVSPEWICNASGWIREHPMVELGKDDWDFLKLIKTPSVGEKADKLLLFFASKYPKPNQPLDINYNEEMLSSCWAMDKGEGEYLFFHYLFAFKQFIKLSEHPNRPFIISPIGWDYLNTLHQVNKDSQIGFCAMWFDDSVTPLWHQGIEHAIQNAGYEAIRIDKHQHNNRIDDEIISMIRRSKFVVADFTGSRGGVYFEAGYALGLGLQVIWTVREDELANIHFDNRQYSFIKWTENAINEFRDNLQYRIEATIGRGPLKP